MKSEKPLGAIGKIDDNLISAAISDTPKKTSLFKYILGIAACICVVVLLFAIKDSLETDRDINADGDIMLESHLVLDSDIHETNLSNKEIVEFLNEYDANSIDKAFVYVHSSTASGTKVTVTKTDQSEQLMELVSLIFGDDIEYEETSREYNGKGYNFYITYINSESDESFTVFVFDNRTIRVNGSFLETSRPLDYTGVNDAINNLKK
ncbi:MAG: hypothetical protein QM426_07050 [Euryarchaeota archaeon]|nr:hypothetical protein [Euryarchaeota archaeon]